MAAMKTSHLFFLAFVCILGGLRAEATVLPESCGQDGAKFSVKVTTPQSGEASPEIPPPAAGKAQIVFIETLNTEGLHLTTPTTRVGVDGEWIGANKGDSHFSIDVAPGEHNVCVNWQSGIDDESNKVGMDTFTAEAGKIYYYEVKIVRLPQGGNNLDILFQFSQVGGIAGRYRARASGVSTYKLQK